MPLSLRSSRRAFRAMIDLPAFRLRYEWEPFDGVKASPHRATWARLEVWVGEDCISQIEDVGSGSTSRSLYGPLYSLAEWIAYNWWFLVADARPAALAPTSWTFRALRRAPRRAHRWLSHHNMKAAGDGFAWPDVTFIPEGPLTRSWIGFCRPTAFLRIPYRSPVGGQTGMEPICINHAHEGFLGWPVICNPKAIQHVPPEKRRYLLVMLS